MAEIIITSQNFDSAVLGSNIPVLLDFWAEWCGPCRMISPIVAEIAERYDGKVTVGKVNVDDQSELANRFEISSIPTLLVIKNGDVVDKAIGYRPKEAVAEMLDRVI